MSSTTVEIIFLDKPPSSHRVAIDIHHENFTHVLEKFTHHRSPTLSECIVIGGKHFENTNNKELRFFEKCIESIIIGDQTCTVCHRLKQLSPQSFPSTTQVHEIYSIRRATVNLSEHVTLVFETQTYSDRQSVRKMYMSYVRSASDHASVHELIQAVSGEIRGLIRM